MIHIDRPEVKINMCVHFTAPCNETVSVIRKKTKRIIFSRT